MWSIGTRLTEEIVGLEMAADDAAAAVATRGEVAAV